MAGHQRDINPLQVDRLVESEHRAGVDLAWIVVVGVVLCVLAIAFAVPDGLLARINDTGGINVNGVLALVTVVPLGAGLFAFRRYRDAVGAQRELTHLSLHDALTGLPNRRHLREVLPEAFQHASRHNTRTGVFFIDLDGFKAVNDTYGHEVGDRLMVAVADRLRRGAGADRWVARYAGDEFVIIDPAPQTSEHCARFANELVGLIETPFELGEDRIAISASVGVAFGDMAADPDEVVRDADTAMYDAKHRERRTAVFSETMRMRLTPATAEKRLQRALDQGEFKLFYEPIVALRSSHIVGVEALIRWDDPERGIVPPGDFLGSLEETGLIVPVGRWVLEEAARQARRWAELAPAGQRPLRATVNVTPRQLGQSDFVDDVSTAIQRTGVDPTLLYLELTEAALVTDARTAWTVLSRVRALGVGLALDEFGTGFSSLSHLRNFDLELLKLDGSYVAGLGTKRADEAIVRHVVALARDLGIATAGDGIDNEGQVRRLLELGCELGQGYHFSAPQPAPVIEGRLRRQYGLVGAGAVPDAPRPEDARQLLDEPEPSDVATVVLPKLRRAAGTPG